MESVDADDLVLDDPVLDATDDSDTETTGEQTVAPEHEHEAPLAGLTVEQRSKVLDEMLGAAVNWWSDPAVAARCCAFRLVEQHELSSRTALDYFNDKVQVLDESVQQQHRRQLLLDLFEHDHRDDGKIRYEWWVYSTDSSGGPFLVGRSQVVMAVDEDEALSLLIGCLPDDLAASRQQLGPVPCNHSTGVQVNSWHRGTAAREPVAQQVLADTSGRVHYQQQWKVIPNSRSQKAAEHVEQQARPLGALLQQVEDDLEGQVRLGTRREQTLGAATVAMEHVVATLTQLRDFCDEPTDTHRGQVDWPATLQTVCRWFEQDILLAKDVLNRCDDPSFDGPDLRDAIIEVIDTVQQAREHNHRWWSG